MVHFLRLIVLSVMFFSSVANASGIVPGVAGGFKITWSDGNWGLKGGTASGPTRQSLVPQYCPQYLAIYDTTYGGCGLSSDQSGIQANGTNWYNIGPPIVVDPTYQSCPVDSTNINGSCVCNDPLISNGASCVADPQSAVCSGLSGSGQKFWLNTTVLSLAERSICDTESGGCSVTVKPDFCGTYDGQITCSGPGVFTGATCTGVSAPVDPIGNPDSPRPDPLPPGTCPGTVNGVEVTVPCKDTTTSTKKESVNDDGNGNVESKTENKVTACTGSSCNTTTTTITSVNGGSTTTTTNTITQSKGQFCADNPGSVECGDGEGSSFSGTCQSDFVCDGDAIQCAIAKEIYKQNCKLNEATDESALYNASKNETGSQIGDLPGNETKNVGPGSFNTTNLLGAQTCIADKAITVMGQTVTLPFSTVCQYLEMLGNVLLSVSFLLAGRIIVRG